MSFRSVISIKNKLIIEISKRYEIRLRNSKEYFKIKIHLEFHSRESSRNEQSRKYVCTEKCDKEI